MIRRRGERVFQIGLELGADGTGKRLRKWVTFHGTQRQAEAEEQRLLHLIRVGDFADPGRMTVGQLFDRWLKDYAATNLRPKTIETYSDFLEVHLRPAFGPVPLPRLTPLRIQGYYTEKLESGRRDGKGGLSRQTVLHHHRLLHKILAQAVRWQLLTRNPADAVEAPRPEDTERPVLTDAQMALLLQGADGTRLFLPILLTFATGFRRGEVLGLRWEQVDLEQQTLRVKEALCRTRKDGLYFAPPKTRAGRRTFRIPPQLVEEFRRHKAGQAEQRLLLGDRYRYQGLVIAGPEGDPLSPNSFTGSFRQLLARLELPPVHFHDLRHTHITGLAIERVPLRAIASRAGHQDPGLTLRRYQHLVAQLDQQAEEAAERMVRRVLRDPAS